MGLNLTHLRLQYFKFTLFFAFFTLNIGIVCEAQSTLNVTIDYQDASIIYSPPGAWSTSMPSDLDYGGAHKLTENPDATASLNFTGVAIYFISPLWPYTVTTAVSVDYGSPYLINLVDNSSTPTNGGFETVNSSVVWGATGLANTQHNLLISVGENQPFAVVDGLIITTVLNVSSSSSPSQLPTSSSSPIITSSTTSATPSPTSTSKSRVAIPLGSVLGVFGLFIIVGGVWFLFRRRKKRSNSEAWTLDGSDASMSRNLSTGPPNTPDNKETWVAEQLYDNNGYPMNQPNDENSSWHSPRHEYVGIPTPPEPYYHTGYQNGISPRSAMHQMTARIPNRYEPGGTLSTIMEGSTSGEGRTPLENSPPPYQSDLAYYKTKGSEGYFQ